MSEEIRKPGTEINEAALDGVSGRNFENEVYERFCYHCDHRKNCRSGRARVKDLIAWIYANGTPKVCPFYND